MALALVSIGCATMADPAGPAAAPEPAAAPRAPARPAMAAVPRVPASTAVDITEASVRGHLEFLASDALNGRGSGTRDEWLAATYVGAQFRQWGLEAMGDNGGFVQAIEMAGAQATAPPVLTAGGVRVVHGEAMVVWSMTSASVSGPLVKHAPDADVPAGAVVLVSEGVQPNSVTGAALVLAPATPRQQGQWDARGSRLPGMPARAVKLTSAAPTRASVVYLDEPTHAALSAMPAGTAMSFEAAVELTESTYTWNAVGRLQGGGPNADREVVVLSAHLDHVGSRGEGDDTIYNGADDDASGTVAVMELARALANGPQPRRTIVFALFGSEERGGLGAGYFVDLPVVPLDDIVADLQFEMIGRPDPLVPPQTLWLTGYERSNLGAALADRGARLVADPHPEQNFFNRSDNIRFARRGIVAHTVSSFGLHEQYHRPNDEIEFVDFVHMTEAIRSMLEPVRWLADSDFVPEWAPGGRPGG